MRTLATQRRIAWAWVLLTWLACLWMLCGCAHTPDPPPGDACQPWQDGWVEYRPADCAYWRCDAVTRRWTKRHQEEGPCL
jgi:hypothetical protein